MGSMCGLPTPHGTLTCLDCFQPCNDSFSMPRTADIILRGLDTVAV